MRFYEKNKPKEGDTRIVEKFLWFPIWANKEWRWLESAKILYQYYSRGPGEDDFNRWNAEKFLN